MPRSGDVSGGVRHVSDYRSKGDIARGRHPSAAPGRELELLSLIAEGRGSRTIARRLSGRRKVQPRPFRARSDDEAHGQPAVCWLLCATLAND